MSGIMPIVEHQANRESVLYIDGFRTYDGLAYFDYKKHYRIKHSHNEFASGKNHINGIVPRMRDWGLCKVRLAHT